MLCGVVAYLTMDFMMTAAPLAMELCGIGRVQSNHGIEMHVVAMYAPSFFTGRLISRFGAGRIVLAGFLLTAASAVVGASGLSVEHFWLSLVLLGLGWNFGWLGASALVLSSHTPDEARRVQSINDFAVFGTMAIGSFMSGGLLSRYGWATVSVIVLVPLTIAALCLLRLRALKPVGAAAS